MLLIAFDVKILKLSFIGRTPATTCDLLIQRYQNLFYTIYITDEIITHSHNFTHIHITPSIFSSSSVSAKIYSSEEEGGGVGISSAKFNLSLLYFLWAGLINLKNKASNSGTLCKGSWFYPGPCCPLARHLPSGRVWFQPSLAATLHLQRSEQKTKFMKCYSN